MRVLGGTYLTERELWKAGVEAGTNVRVHSTAILVDLHNIAFGSNCRVDPFCVISAAGGDIRIGNHVHVASHAILVGGAGIELEDFSGLSQGVRVYSVSDDYSGQSLTNPTIPQHLQRVTRAAVRIGRHAIVGSGSVILPGGHVAEGCAVGALSIVNRPLETWGIYAGCPVRRIRDRSQALLADETSLSQDAQPTP